MAGSEMAEGEMKTQWLCEGDVSCESTTVAADTAPAPHYSDPVRPFAYPSVTVGRLTALIPGLPPLVDFPANDTGGLLPARTVVPLHESQIGCEVALTFEDGDFSRPILVGVVQSWDAPPASSPQHVRHAGSTEDKRDPETLLFTAAREITLQCGKASITLTSAGKLLLRGAYLLSRSSGVNRIKGGSVQIN
jgi:hypothetical protein